MVHDRIAVPASATAVTAFLEANRQRYLTTLGTVRQMVDELILRRSDLRCV